MVAKSIRLPDDLASDVDTLRGDRKFTEVVTEALANWVRLTRRLREDAIIAQALGCVGSEQRQEEHELVQLAQRSALEVLEDLDAGATAG